jgi:hypothetical protein
MTLEMEGQTTDAEEITPMSRRWKHFMEIDGSGSWLMCATLLVCSLVGYGCISTYGILFPAILEEFKSGRSVTGENGEYDKPFHVLI